MSEVLELAEKVLGRADGGEQLEVFVQRGVQTNVRAYHGEIENLATAMSAAIGVRVLRDGTTGARIGAAWAGSLEEWAIDEVLANARANLAFATEDEFLSFARPDGVAAAPLSLADPATATTPIEHKIALAIELERVARTLDARVRQVDAADYDDYDSSFAVVSTTGIRATSARTRAILSVEAIATDGGADHTGWGMAAARAPGTLSPEQVATDAVTRAVGMLGAVKPATVKGVAVFEPRTAATLLAIVGGVLSGEAVVKGRSIFADRVGETVAATNFTLVDDPTDSRHLAAAAYDGEGLACRRNALIERGTLLGFVYDTVSAARAHTVSTGSAARGSAAGTPSASCRALQLLPGDRDGAAIVGAVGTGVHVESLTGVHSGVNPISGDFSVGITGHMIRGGVIAEPIREATVASTLQRMLLGVVAVGSDVEWSHGVAASQTLAIDGVALAGA